MAITFGSIQILSANMSTNEALLTAHLTGKDRQLAPLSSFGNDSFQLALNLDDETIRVNNIGPIKPENTQVLHNKNSIYPLLKKILERENFAQQHNLENLKKIGQEESQSYLETLSKSYPNITLSGICNGNTSCKEFHHVMNRFKALFPHLFKILQPKEN